MARTQWCYSPSVSPVTEDVAGNDALRYVNEPVTEVAGHDASQAENERAKVGGQRGNNADKTDSESRRGKPETRRGNSTENHAPPSSAPPGLGESEKVAPPSSNDKKPEVAPPRKERGQAKSKAGTWVEFKPGTKRKDGTRLYYARYRKWKPGNKKKEWCGPVPELDPMTEQEKIDYVNEQRKLKARRKRRENRGRSDKRIA